MHLPGQICLEGGPEDAEQQEDEEEDSCFARVADALRGALAELHAAAVPHRGQLDPRERQHRQQREQREHQDGQRRRRLWPRRHLQVHQQPHQRRQHRRAQRAERQLAADVAVVETREHHHQRVGQRQRRHGEDVGHGARHQVAPERHLGVRQRHRSWTNLNIKIP